ncbi:hypothetical protein BG004_000642 [Podila humilis]|nr:hypothetical protein BG004_000642 [Podila humilis]
MMTDTQHPQPEADLPPLEYVVDDSPIEPAKKGTLVDVKKKQSDREADHIHSEKCLPEHYSEHDRHDLLQQHQQQQLQHQQQQLQQQQQQLHNDYDLLESNGTINQTSDPSVKIYFEAKELYIGAMEILNNIPEASDMEVIEQHKDEIVAVTKDLMAAFLKDEKACIMNQRILKLAEQYEIYVQTYNPEGTSTTTTTTTTADSEEEGVEQQTTIYTKDSVVFVVWILFSGQQWSHCVQTLSFAAREFEDIRPRMLELRASCHMALRNYKRCNEDLEEVLNIKPEMVEIHSMLGNVYYAIHQAQDAASHFKSFVEAAHPDSRTLPNAYYALATLTLQSAPSGATKKKSHQALKQAALLKDAQTYFQRAREADIRFKELYGVVTAFNEIKRTAVLAFQSRAAAQYGYTQDAPTPALLDASEALKRSFKNLSLAFCAQCGHNDNVVNEGRRSADLKSKPLIKCGKCSKVAYCSRPCQVNHWNSTHKGSCNKK